MHLTDPGQAISEDKRREVIARVIRRLVPFAFICYVVAYIDRVNVGFAAAALQKDLGLNDAQFGYGAGLFFVGYFLFEVPSNLILERVGARRWIARILIGWGIVSMAMMFVWDLWSFYAARVLLGIAEAGFFPGIILYLTYWIPAADRARAGALFMMAAPVAIIIGAPISNRLLALNGVLGLHGWQWLFLIEGLPAVVLGFVALRALTDYPSEARWLTDSDRECLIQIMDAEKQRRAAVGHTSIGRSLQSGRVWLLCGVYFLNTVVTYGVFLWLPKMLVEAAGGRQSFGLSVLTTLPFAAALVAMFSCRPPLGSHGERKYHVATCAMTAAAGLVLAASVSQQLWLMVLSFTLSQIGQRSVQGVFWAIPPILLGGTAAAACIGLINAIGNSAAPSDHRSWERSPGDRIV
jgi:MFS family permease